MTNTYKKYNLSKIKAVVVMKIHQDHKRKQNIIKKKNNN